MTKTEWRFQKNSTGVNYENKILSLSYFQGRRNYLDFYDGGLLSVTLDNSNNVAQHFTFNDQFNLGNLFVFGTQQTFWVQGIQFNDYPGNTGLSTITVTLADVLARNGRNVVTNKVLTEKATYSQLKDLFNDPATQIGSAVTDSGNGESIAAATTYTGSVLQYLNLIMSTEKGFLYFNSQSVGLIPRNLGDSAPWLTLTRNAPSSTAISYIDIQRERADLNMINSATVNPEGLASQQVKNTASIALFGSAEESLSTVDATTTQAQGLASWLAYTQSDPAAETYSVLFIDIPQTYDAMEDFTRTLWNSLGYKYRVYELIYRTPGAVSDSTIKVVFEGVQINSTSEVATFEVFFSPLSFYQVFRLDDAVLGILDTSRLGW